MHEGHDGIELIMNKMMMKVTDLKEMLRPGGAGGGGGGGGGDGTQRSLEGKVTSLLEQVMRGVKKVNESVLLSKNDVGWRMEGLEARLVKISRQVKGPDELMSLV